MKEKTKRMLLNSLTSNFVECECNEISKVQMLQKTSASASRSRAGLYDRVLFALLRDQTTRRILERLLFPDGHLTKIIFYLPQLGRSSRSANTKLQWAASAIADKQWILFSKGLCRNRENIYKWLT